MTKEDQFNNKVDATYKDMLPDRPLSEEEKILLFNCARDLIKDEFDIEEDLY